MTARGHLLPPWHGVEGMTNFASNPLYISPGLIRVSRSRFGATRAAQDLPAEAPCNCVTVVLNRPVTVVMVKKSGTRQPSVRVRSIFHGLRILYCNAMRRIINFESAAADSLSFHLSLGLSRRLLPSSSYPPRCLLSLSPGDLERAEQGYRTPARITDLLRMANLRPLVFVNRPD